jgi:hypothetical protein
MIARDASIIFIFLPVLVFHLLDLLELVIVIGPLLFELLLLLSAFLLLLVLHLALPIALQLLLQLRVQIRDAYLFVLVGAAVVLGCFEGRIEGDLLLALGVRGHVFLFVALSGWVGTSSFLRYGVLG